MLAHPLFATVVSEVPIRLRMDFKGEAQDLAPVRRLARGFWHADIPGSEPVAFAKVVDRLRVQDDISGTSPLSIEDMDQLAHDMTFFAVLGSVPLHVLVEEGRPVPTGKVVGVDEPFPGFDAPSIYVQDESGTTGMLETGTTLLEPYVRTTFDESPLG